MNITQLTASPTLRQEAMPTLLNRVELTQRTLRLSA